MPGAPTHGATAPDAPPPGLSRQGPSQHGVPQRGVPLQGGPARRGAAGARRAASGAEREAAGAAYACPADARQWPDDAPREHPDRARADGPRAGAARHGGAWTGGVRGGDGWADDEVRDGDGGPAGLGWADPGQAGRSAPVWGPDGAREVGRADAEWRGGGAGDEAGDEAGDPDAVEHALRQVCELIESAVSLHRRRGEQPAAMVVTDDGPAARRTVHQLIAQARHGVSVIVSSRPDQAQSLAPLLDQLSAVANRGVAVRVLCAADALETPGVATAVRRGLAGHEVRVETGDLQGGVIVDGQTAFVHAGPGQSGRYASVIEDPASVRVLDLMFAAAWRTAMPMAEHLRLADRLRTDSVRKILDRLRAGRTDDVAAREIQVSLRTYRRHVAAIMRDVGANSRFQAGVRAYELGLLGPA
ncbi:TrmB family transcriptional regulator sugar-binding domain-containing protein [Streptomyces buecherae]|uniref:helix-turn-helix transcriptional regulator n=1 Tax=Streptomyces buecherae TaxID=2763006 RepID=UPI00367B05DA